MENGKKVEEYINEVIVKIGEKFIFCRFEIVLKIDVDVFGVYLYMGGCIGVLIVFEGFIDEVVVKDVVMYIVVVNFKYIDCDVVIVEEVEYEC